EPNLAEYHLDWWNGFNQFYNGDLDPPTGDGLEVHQGGDYRVSTAYLSRCEGAVRDIDGQSYSSPPPRSDTSWHYYYPREVYWLNAYEDLSNINTLKQMIMDYGVMGTCMCYSGSFIQNYIHYQPPTSTDDPNHSVSIVGWDDNKVTQAPLPGAWIVKNSWGTGWGNDGFFYLAYNSSCVRGVAYLEYKDPVPGEELLYWDEAGFVDSVGDGNSSSWMASVFTANQSGNLTHIDFWTTSNNAEYDVHVWNGFFGSELANQTGTCQEYGYYSIPLNTPIPMDAGQQFTIGVNMTTPGYGYPIPVECAIAWTVNPTIQSNVSFIRQNASDSWMDMADDGWNACLRARVVNTPDITSFAPETSVNDTEWATRTFNITTDQTANVAWLINGTFVQDANTSVITASYTNTSAALGVWNVSAVVESANGIDMQTWIWNVTARVPGDVTGDDDVTIGDATLLFNWVSFVNERETTYALNKSENADVTGNGVVNIGDAVLLFNWVAFGGGNQTTYVLK
ncbi:MAG: DUF4082 domain-containing protein, partial [Methanosarcinales archaeon]|nr:DUF4082 domain-containing protein [Methanosarcinales archaeon]